MQAYILVIHCIHCTIYMCLTIQKNTSPDNLIMRCTSLNLEFQSVQKDFDRKASTTSYTKLLPVKIASKH